MPSANPPASCRPAVAYPRDKPGPSGLGHWGTGHPSPHGAGVPAWEDAVPRHRADTASHTGMPNIEAIPVPTSCPLAGWQEKLLSLLEATSATATAPCCCPRETTRPWSRLRAGFQQLELGDDTGPEGLRHIPQQPSPTRSGKGLICSPFGLSALIKQCL